MKSAIALACGAPTVGATRVTICAFSPPGEASAWIATVRPEMRKRAPSTFCQLVSLLFLKGALGATPQSAAPLSDVTHATCADAAASTATSGVTSSGEMPKRIWARRDASMAENMPFHASTLSTIAALDMGKRPAQIFWPLATRLIE